MSLLCFKGKVFPVLLKLKCRDSEQLALSRQLSCSSQVKHGDFSIIVFKCVGRKVWFKVFHSWTGKPLSKSLHFFL